ncbi:hypothetical protein [Arthrobacter nitrophenolicus]|uniref:Polysaccharide biosynthesis protein n=1 Tax=Arthrobacter nitrophenolicus TaxID=683150 RepID=A0A4R5Y902_9MICC|nr:hypothetical protein [Arthrobacter nitrophenolicus]TDL41113.1 hypothetical protein E2R57_00015 [Arthrobacter nitrophenolicus]
MIVFALAPAISLMAPLVALPAISAVHGSDGWSSIAIGQSLGTAISVVVELGWGITGPISAARQSQSHVSRLFRRSLWERSVVYAVLIPVIIGVVAVLKPASPVAAVLAALSMAMNGLAASWLYVALSKPLHMVFLDTLPRAGSSLLGALAITTAKAPLEVLPAIQIVGAALAMLAPLLFLPSPISRAEIKNPWAAIAHQFWASQGAALLTRLSTTAYVALPTVILAAVAPPQAVASYAAVDRLARAGLSGLGSAGLAFQGWIPGATGTALIVRLRTALLFNIVLAVFSAAGFWMVAPYLLRLLFLDAVSVDALTINSFAGVVALVVLSRCTGIQCLAVLGRTWQVAISTAIGFFVSIPLIVITGQRWGASGVALTVMTVELLVLVIQLIHLLNVFRARPAPFRSSPITGYDATQTELARSSDR